MCSFAVWVDGSLSLWLLMPKSLNILDSFLSLIPHIQSIRKFCWLYMASSYYFSPNNLVLISALPFLAGLNIPTLLSLGVAGYLTCFNQINVSRIDGYHFQWLL